jgi:hypothetical protein
VQEIHTAAQNKTYATGHITLRTRPHTFGGQNHRYIAMYARYTEDIAEDTTGGSRVIVSCPERVGQLQSLECCERVRAQLQLT